MRVLILANNDIGLYKFRKELIEELIHPGSYIDGRKGKPCKVYISLPYGDYIPELKRMGCRFINTPVDRRGVNPVTDLKLLMKYRTILKKVKPDVVLGYTIKPNIYGGIICCFLHVSYAINVTGLGTAFQKSGLLRRVVTALYRISLKNAKTIFFENEENRQVFIKESIVSEEKTCLLMGAGVNLDRYYVTDYPAGETTKFLFMGRVMKEKGIDELFQAMHMLIEDGFDCSLDILGSYEEDYKKMIEKYETEGWLNYYGYQSDVAPFISATHCLVLPSWHEGMANTNLEGAASGRPIITSNIHGCLEAVEDGVSGYLVKRKNIDDLYKVMKKFIGLSYQERKKMGLAGRKRMEKYFDKKKVVEKTISRL